MLTKRYGTVYEPGQPAVPAIPYRAAQTICTVAPAPGEWRTTFTDVRVAVPSGNGGVSVPAGTVSTRYETVAGKEYVVFTVRTSTWVETGPAGAPVCVTYPEQPFVPGKAAVPGRYRTYGLFGWDAGANSEKQLDGDVEVKLNMAPCVGVVVGLTQFRDGVGNVERISHGFYFHQGASGSFQAAVIEAGRLRSEILPVVAADVWAIRRRAGRVQYVLNNSVVAVSDVESIGVVSVGGCLYASGDMIP